MAKSETPDLILMDLSLPVMDGWQATRQLKDTGDVRPRRVDNVAALFADVVGFTSDCEKRAPETIQRDPSNSSKNSRSPHRCKWHGEDQDDR